MHKDISEIKQESVSHKKDIAAMSQEIKTLYSLVKENTKNFNKMFDDLANRMVSRWAFNLIVSMVMAVCGYIVAMTNMNSEKIQALSEHILLIEEELSMEGK